MNIKTLEQIIKNKSSKVEFAIVTNLQNGESQVFEPGQKLSGDFDKFQKEVENFFKSKKNGIIENTINNMVIKDINISNIYLSLIFFYKKLCYL